MAVAVEGQDRWSPPHQRQEQPDQEPPPPRPRPTSGEGSVLPVPEDPWALLPVQMMLGKPHNSYCGRGGGSTHVASLTTLCLEALAAAWESHSASVYLPRAYHMP